MADNDDTNTNSDGGTGNSGGDGTSDQVSTEIANRAQIYGWVPQEEFKGDKTKWVPAEVFVKRAEEILPIARSMNRKLESDLTITKKELAEMRQTVKAVIQAHKKAADGGYENQLAQIEKEQIQAVAEADSEKWARLEVDKKKLTKPEEIPFEDKPAGNTDANPVVVQWKKDNDWYDTDPELGTYADSVSNFISTRSPGLPVEDFLARVKAEVKKRFPEKFGNQNRRILPSVDRTDFGGPGDSDGNGKKAYSDLPSDAKKACDDLVKQKVLTREKYVQTYFE